MHVDSIMRGCVTNCLASCMSKRCAYTSQVHTLTNYDIPCQHSIKQALSGVQMHGPMAPTFVGDQATVGHSEAMTGGSLLPAEDIPEMPGLSAALAAASAAMQAAGEAMPAPLNMQQPHQAAVQVRCFTSILCLFQHTCTSKVWLTWLRTHGHSCVNDPTDTIKIQFGTSLHLLSGVHKSKWLG